MTTALTVGFRAELSCSALSRCLLSFWSRSRRPRSWVSLARCLEGFASDFIGAILAATIIIRRAAITRVIADAFVSRTVAVMAAAVAEGTAAAAGVAAADNSAKADFNVGRVAA
jgi:DNA-binding IclR family transcriptional regulator